MKNNNLFIQLREIETYDLAFESLTNAEIENYENAKFQSRTCKSRRLKKRIKKNCSTNEHRNKKPGGGLC